MTAITTLRSTLAAALSNPTQWQVFSYPPASPIANSIVISPDDPYIEASNNVYTSISPLANFKLTLFTPLFDNQGNLADIEAFYVAVWQQIFNSGLSVRWGTISAPAPSSTDTGQMLTSDISISILTDWS